MYVNIDLDFFNKELEEAKKRWEEEVGDASNIALWPNLDFKIDETLIEDDELCISGTSNLGYFSIKVPLTTDLMEDLISTTVKKMNKFKTMLEAMK